MTKQQIQQDLTTAQKEKNTQKVEVLRMLLSEVNNEEIRLRAEGKELTDDNIVGIIKRSVKKRNESIEMFEKAGRTDLVESEKQELAILMEYMPEQMTKEQVEQIVNEVINEVGADANFGQVMKQVMAKVKGQADGKLVSEVVREKLS